MGNKIFINLNENNIIYNNDISVDFVMKTIDTETLYEVMSDYATTNNDRFIYFAIKINSKRFINYEKICLKIRQYNDTNDSFKLYSSDIDNFIVEDLDKYIHYTNSNNQFYRIIDLTSIITDDLDKTYYFAILSDNNTASSLMLYNVNSNYNPQLEINYYDDYDFYKKQKFFEGNIGETNIYGINVRNGIFNYQSNLANIDGISLQYNLCINYNIKYNNTNLINNQINTYLPNGFKFNYQQYVFKRGDDYIYIDSSYNCHTFSIVSSSTNSNLYFEKDGNYLTLEVGNELFVITNKNKDKLIFDNNGYLKEIISNINEKYKITINYIVSDNGKDYSKVDNIRDGMHNVYKFKYFTLSGKKYIFVLMNNFEDLSHYTLIDYKDKSIGYIIYNDNCLETIVDKFKKETSFTYNIDYSLINKIRRCNKELEIIYGADSKIKEIYENDYYDYIDEENELYEERKLPMYNVKFNYFGTSSKVISSKYNKNARKRVMNYIFNAKQECISVYEDINSKLANINYNDMINCSNVSISDNLNTIIYDQTSYEINGNLLSTPIIDNLFSSAYYTYLLILRPKVTSSLNITSNHYITLNTYLFDDLSLENYSELSPNTYNLSLEHDNFIVFNYTQKADNLKYIFFQTTLNSNYEIICNKIFTNGNVTNNKLVDSEDELNVKYNIYDTLNVNDIIIDTNQFLPTNSYLSLNDVHNNFCNYYNSNGSYIFWYNDGKKLKLVQNDVKYKGSNFFNNTILNVSHNGQNEITYKINYVDFSGSYYIDIEKRNKQIWFNKTLVSNERYDSNGQIIYSRDETNTYGQYHYDIYGNQHKVINRKSWVISKSAYKIEKNCDLSTNLEILSDNQYGHTLEIGYVINNKSILDENKKTTEIYSCLKGLTNVKNTEDIICWNMEYFKNMPSRVFVNINNNVNENNIEYNLDGYVSSYTDNGIRYDFHYGARHDLIKVIQDNFVIIENNYNYQAYISIINTIYNGKDKYEYVYSKYDQLLEVRKYESITSSVKQTILKNNYINYEKINNNYHFTEVPTTNITITPISRLKETIEYDGLNNTTCTTIYSYDKLGTILNIQKTNNNKSLKIEYDNGIHNNYEPDFDAFAYNQKSYFVNNNIQYCQTKIEKIGEATYTIGEELNSEKVPQITYYYNKNEKIIANGDNDYELLYRKNSNVYSGKDVEYIHLRDDINNVWWINKDYEYLSYNNNANYVTYPIRENFTYKYQNNNNSFITKTETLEYGYDANDRINKEILKKGNDIIYEKHYKYDILNRIIREDNISFNRTKTYEYDNYGNILTINEYSYTTSDTLGDPIYVCPYVYHDRFDESNPAKNKHMLKEFDSLNKLIYDDFNRLISFGIAGEECRRFEWDNKNMVKYNRYDDEITFKYNASGIRTNKTFKNIYEGNTISIDYLTDENKIIKEDRSNGISIKYLYFNNDIIGFIYNNDYYIYQKNIVGDIIAILKDKEIVARYVYDAWGNHKVKNPNGSNNYDKTFIGNINPFRYKGYYYDVETGLFWLSSRYYSPELCRFISPDSVDYLDPNSINGLNLYAYCNNDPVNMCDPSGHIAISTLLIGMAIGFGVGFAIGGGFEIAKQAYNGGDWNWDMFSWNWGQIGLSALGGAVAGAISSISFGSGVVGYLTTFATGGFGSVLGGMISGSVTDLQSGLIAFGIGAVANVAARGITAIINKGVSASAQKALSNPIFDDMTLGDLVGSGLKNNGYAPAHNKFLNYVGNLFLKANGQWARSSMYSFANAGISNLLSGWY